MQNWEGSPEYNGCKHNRDNYWRFGLELVLRTSIELNILYIIYLIIGVTSVKAAALKALRQFVHN